MRTVRGIPCPLLVLADSPAAGHLPEPMTEEEILACLVRYGLGQPGVSVDTLTARGGLADQIRFLEARTRNSPLTELFFAGFLCRYLETWQQHSRLMRAYRPEKYPDPVLFFSRTEVIPEFPTGQARAWMEYLTGDVRNIPVPGHHISMNAGEGARLMSRSLQARLNEPGGKTGFSRQTCTKVTAAEKDRSLEFA